MLTVSLNRLVPTGINSVTLFKDEAYYYADRSTYDACTIISHLYDFNRLINSIGTQDDDKIAYAEWLFETLPKPINVLAPFTALVDEVLPYDVEDAIKALHIITSALSPLKYLEVPAEIRKDVIYSLSIIEEAELSTTVALAEMVDYDVVLNAVKGGYQQQPQTYVPTATVGNAETANTEDLFDYVVDENTPEDIVKKHPLWAEIGPHMYIHIETEEVYSFDMDYTPSSDIPEEEYIPEIEEEEDDLEEYVPEDTSSEKKKLALLLVQ